jgi:hypothetical protein
MNHADGGDADRDGDVPHPFDNTALVIEWHVLACSCELFTPAAWIKRFGVLR